MGYGVLDKRLNQQRRNATITTIRIDLKINFETFTEANLLNVEKSFRQFQFVGESNLVFTADGERASHEIGKQQAHAPRGDRIGYRQRADGVQAVKQEMRVDLRAESPQLRL